MISQPAIIARFPDDGYSLRIRDEVFILERNFDGTDMKINLPVRVAAAVKGQGFFGIPKAEGRDVANHVQRISGRDPWRGNVQTDMDSPCRTVGTILDRTPLGTPEDDPLKRRGCKDCFRINRRPPEIPLRNRFHSMTSGWREAAVPATFVMDGSTALVFNRITIGKGFAYITGPLDVRVPETSRMTTHPHPPGDVPLSKLRRGAHDQKALAVHCPERQGKVDLQSINQ